MPVNSASKISAEPAAAREGDGIDTSLRQAMRRLVSGVSIVAVAEDGVRHGLVVNSLASVALDPPTVLICVNRNASSHDPIGRCGRFGVSILGEADRPTAQWFIDPRSRSQRFETGAWQQSAHGNPLLATALARLDCTIVNSVEVGSHTIFIAAVDAVALRDDPLAPLLHFSGGFRNIA